MRDEEAADAAMTLAYDHPFCGRPQYGARERFRAHFRALIYPIVAELECWTAKERLQSQVVSLQRALDVSEARAAAVEKELKLQVKAAKLRLDDELGFGGLN